MYKRADFCLKICPLSTDEVLSTIRVVHNEWDLPIKYFFHLLIDKSFYQRTAVNYVSLMILLQKVTHL